MMKPTNVLHVSTPPREGMQLKDTLQDTDTHQKQTKFDPGQQ